MGKETGVPLEYDEIIWQVAGLDDGRRLTVKGHSQGKSAVHEYIYNVKSYLFQDERFRRKKVL